jgi:sulfite reductase alpha subunit-like flavoprotein
LLTSSCGQSIAGDELQIDFVKGTMALPAIADRPIVCVGPGTGVAPLRALIQRRIAFGETRNTIYFGCRKRDCDFLFRADWERWAADGQLELRAAFSRDQVRKLVPSLVERGERC